MINLLTLIYDRIAHLYLHTHIQKNIHVYTHIYTKNIIHIDYIYFIISSIYINYFLENSKVYFIYYKSHSNKNKLKYNILPKYDSPFITSCLFFVPWQITPWNHAGNETVIMLTIYKILDDNMSRGNKLAKKI